ncbi:DUF6879 family protein [Kitasatospora sp. NPDC048239]|uniref:DUF6879 family protein n=1 Tax=Kitasatospora sp. NPDC048239 TaxID=3364046 RepID=UPI00371B97D5
MIGKGKRFERVRLVDDPPTEGQRYLLACARTNVAAGEDIRCMWRSEAEAAGLAGLSDFWLFDSRTVARFHFEGDRTVGMELVDPLEVLRACQARDAAWHHATLHADFLGPVPPAE